MWITCYVPAAGEDAAARLLTVLREKAGRMGYMIVPGQTIRTRPGVGGMLAATAEARKANGAEDAEHDGP